LRIKDIIENGLQLQNDFGKKLHQKIEELKDHAEEEYKKTQKKKDPDFDRASYNPRLTDDILAELVRVQLSSAACMNKGFILDGFPRSKDDAELVFMNDVPVEKPENGENDPEGAGEEEPGTKKVLNDKIIPQYCISLEADDAFLTHRAKEIPHE
jgi:adenylate kinase